MSRTIKRLALCALILGLVTPIALVVNLRTNHFFGAPYSTGFEDAGAHAVAMIFVLVGIPLLLRYARPAPSRSSFQIQIVAAGIGAAVVLLLQGSMLFAVAIWALMTSSASTLLKPLGSVLCATSIWLVAAWFCAAVGTKVPGK